LRQPIQAAYHGLAVLPENREFYHPIRQLENSGQQVGQEAYDYQPAQDTHGPERLESHRMRFAVTLGRGCVKPPKWLAKLLKAR
jgi:hypothetical protein